MLMGEDAVPRRFEYQCSYHAQCVTGPAVRRPVAHAVAVQDGPLLERQHSGGPPLVEQSRRSRVIAVGELHSHDVVGTALHEGLALVVADDVVRRADHIVQWPGDGGDRAQAGKGEELWHAPTLGPAPGRTRSQPLSSRPWNRVVRRAPAVPVSWPHAKGVAQGR